MGPIFSLFNVIFFPLADEFIHKEALESLLTKLVNGTEFSNISSLEKTYFSINNLIHRNRKSTDKTILIEVC